MLTVPAGCFAKRGFREDVARICQIVERAKAYGAKDDDLNRVATWLEEVMPVYLDKREILIGGARRWMVSLRRGMLAEALRRKIKAETGLCL